MPEEVRFFGRLGAWGVVVGGGYWLLTRETTGAVVLIGFGIGTGFLALMFALDVRRTGRGRVDERPWRWVGLPSRETDEGPFADEEARFPAATSAPLLFSIGVALATLGLAFGPWLYLAATLPLLAGGRAWLRGAMAEYRAIDADGEARSHDPGGDDPGGEPGAG